MRWFEEERRGFAFGCVFATGEFGGLMAFIVGWLLSRHDTGGYKTVYFIGGSSMRRPPPCLASSARLANCGMRGYSVSTRCETFVKLPIVACSGTGNVLGW
jgi:hypothetical protein